MNLEKRQIALCGAAVFSLVMSVSCNDGTSSSTPTSASVVKVTPPNSSGPQIAGLIVNGPATLTQRGASAQFSAIVTMSTGAAEDRTSSATWSSSNTAVATVSPTGVVTAQGDGAATISAVVAFFQAVKNVTVATAPPARRTPDPAAGQRIPLPDVQAFIAQANAARPDLMAQSCNRGLKYVRNPWIDYIVDQLRTLDTRWGYNGKPTRTAADNEGVPVEAAGDEIAYHYGSGPDQGSPDVYLIDILAGHCGTPSLTYRVFTGEEPGFWTSAGRSFSAKAER
jgi:hypothetical protein